MIPALFHDSWRLSGVKIKDEPTLWLTQDDWDDYTYGLQFGSHLDDSGERTSLGSFRLYFDGHKKTYELFRSANVSRVDDFCSSFGGLFISAAESLEFYQVLLGKIGFESATALLLALHDVSALKAFRPDDASLSLVETEAYKRSFLRFGAAVLEPGGAQSLIQIGKTKTERFSFGLEFKAHVSDVTSRLEFSFHDSPLPSSLNVLIGKNGVGKTQTLYALTQALVGTRVRLGPKPSMAFRDVRVVGDPPISQVVAVAFSPFDGFPTCIEREPGVTPASQVLSFPPFAYCGFRDSEGTPKTLTMLWRELLRRFRSILKQDEDARASIGRQNKLEALLSALQSAFAFDEIYAESKGDRTLLWPRYDVVGSFLPSSGRLEFWKGGAPLRLSAGQSMFVALTFSIVEHIRERALLLLDEPELHLHPNLEVQFVRLLLNLLKTFNASAIVATHSITMAREVPSTNLLILDVVGDELVAAPPNFQTFGADLNTIGNYVFNDVYADPPHLMWLDVELQRLGLDGTLSTYREHLSPESLLYLRAKGSVI